MDRRRIIDRHRCGCFLLNRLPTIEGVKDSETFLNLEIIKETYY